MGDGTGNSDGGGSAAATDHPPRVFLSYAHESPEHENVVRDLWIFLRSREIDAKLDMPAAERRQDWPLWMLTEVRAADYVLILASPQYRRRSDGEAA
ncbi:SEFIR domain-containing protein, partial [Frankia sp. Cr2]|uniref:SEFIR domain-containing protein n=1 Tax=Frankia sp. Cr2 TaxID=3073932 RepID=UPI002AD5ADD0